MGQGASSQDDTLKHIGVFSDVVAHIKSEYVEEPDMKSVTLGALNGLLEAVDPFASYLNRSNIKRIPEGQGPQARGRGPDSLEEAGLPGRGGRDPGFAGRQGRAFHHDMIESIKGVSTRDMPLAYAAPAVAGGAGKHGGTERGAHPPA